MVTLGEYLQTWTLKFSTTKTVLAVFHLNKEAKRELKVKYNNETLPFCSEPKYVGVTLDKICHVSPTPWVTLQEADITRHAPEAACWLRLRCCSNNSANSHPGLGALNRRVLPTCLVPQCSYPPHRPHHQWGLAICDRMPPFYSSGQPSNPRRHLTCWASSQWSHTVSRPRSTSWRFWSPSYGRKTPNLVRIP